MLNFFQNLNPVMQAFIATLFTWFITLLGSSLIFMFKKINKPILDKMLGISAGVMLAASFWSLLSPAISQANNIHNNKIIAIAICIAGFLAGGILLYIGDKLFQKYEPKFASNNHKQSFMLISSITIHNIPEGLAVGVAFGSILYNLDGATLISSLMLTLGIGIQNFPEGLAVSAPLLRNGMSKKKAFFFGQLSGIVEPISGIIGALLVLKIRLLLPFLLSFAAGSMIYVVVNELVPESQENDNKPLITIYTLIGFIIMMTLDVLLG